MTDNEIIKALEYWKKFDNEIDQMLSGRFKDDKMLIEQKEIVKITLNHFDLINRQKAIIEKSEKVEHFADKAIETANAEIENLKVENQSLRSAANSLKMHYEEAQAEIERLKESLNIELENFATEYDNKIKAEAYKECIEKIQEEIKQALESNYKARAERIEKHNVGETDEFISYCQGKIDCLRGLDDFLDNLLKEMQGENND